MVRSSFLCPLRTCETLTTRYDMYRLAKIKAWIDENNPGDLLIPFSVSLEERLIQMPDDAAREEELKNLGTTGALNKITTAGYASLHVSPSPALPLYSFGAASRRRIVLSFCDFRNFELT